MKLINTILNLISVITEFIIAGFPIGIGLVSLFVAVWGRADNVSDLLLLIGTGLVMIYWSIFGIAVMIRLRKSRDPSRRKYIKDQLIYNTGAIVLYILYGIGWNRGLGFIGVGFGTVVTFLIIFAAVNAASIVITPFAAGHKLSAEDEEAPVRDVERHFPDDYR